MLSKFKFSTKIFVHCIGIILCFSIILVGIYPMFKKSIQDSRYLKTKQLVESASGILDYYAQQARASSLSLDDVKKRTREAIKNLRYGRNNYFWINDVEPRMIMHPFRPDLDGKNLSGFKDPNGKRLFVAFVEICKKDGEGFVDYYWPDANNPDDLYVGGFRGPANIMWTGHYALMQTLYERSFNTGEHTEEITWFIEDWQNSVLTDGFGNLKEGGIWGTGIIPCEPYIVFVQCNTIPMLTTEFYNIFNGPNSFPLWITDLILLTR